MIDLFAPWTYDPKTDRIIGNDAAPIAFISPMRTDFDDVEGRMGPATRIGHMAAAAPDLYAALQALSEHCAEYIRSAGLTPDMQQAEAVLAKARGEVAP